MASNRKATPLGVPSPPPIRVPRSEALDEPRRSRRATLRAILAQASWPDAIAAAALVLFLVLAVLSWQAGYFGGGGGSARAAASAAAHAAPARAASLASHAHTHGDGHSHGAAAPDVASASAARTGAFAD
jgi:hypothetical protein